MHLLFSSVEANIQAHWLYAQSIISRSINSFSNDEQA
jgi:hypothetical protein